MKTLTGKIASLPFQIRCEVNKRIRAREHPAATANWLNSEYSVLEVLEGKFEHAPITAADIEKWRNGGFLEWMPGTDFSEHVHFISQYAADVRTAGLTTDDLFMTVLAHHAQFIRGMELVSDEVASRRMTLVERLTKSVLSLRRSELAEARKEIELGRLELARECKHSKSESSVSSSQALSSPENPASLCDARTSTTPALQPSNFDKSEESDHSMGHLVSSPAEDSPENSVHQVHAVHQVHSSAPPAKAAASHEPVLAPVAPTLKRAAPTPEPAALSRVPAPLRRVPGP